MGPTCAQAAARTVRCVQRTPTAQREGTSTPVTDFSMRALPQDRVDQRSGAVAFVQIDNEQGLTGFAEGPRWPPVSLHPRIFAEELALSSLAGDRAPISTSRCRVESHRKDGFNRLDPSV